jgi:hypothetical protein
MILKRNTRYFDQYCIILFSVRRPDEGYSRNVPCALDLIIYGFFYVDIPSVLKH